MKPKTILRIAAVITLLYCLAHTAGIPWTPVRGPGEIAVIDAMRADRFVAAGFSRTYWDFYFGFGVSIIFFLLIQAVVLWQLASIATSDAKVVRPIVAAFLLAFAANAVVAWTCFFAFPAIFAIAITACLAWAFIAAGKAPR